VLQAPRSPAPPTAPNSNSRLRDFIAGQDPSAPPQAAPTFKRNSPAWQMQVKEVIFENQPMGEVIKWLRPQFPEINFVCAPEVEDVPVRMNLHNVTLDDIFVALNITSKGELVANPMNENMVSFFYRPAFAKEQAQRKTARAYSLSSYLSGRSPEESAKALKDLESALDLSLQMLLDANPDARFEKPRLNLHAPTKMLIAVGDGEQLEIIERFIGQLERRPNPPQMIQNFGSGIIPQPGQIPSPAQTPQRQLKLPSTNNPASVK
jgi:hypothetical protein